MDVKKRNVFNILGKFDYYTLIDNFMLLTCQYHCHPMIDIIDIIDMIIEIDIVAVSMSLILMIDMIDIINIIIVIILLPLLLCHDIDVISHD